MLCSQIQIQTFKFQNFKRKTKKNRFRLLNLWGGGVLNSPFEIAMVFISKKWIWNKKVYIHGFVSKIV